MLTKYKILKFPIKIEFNKKDTYDVNKISDLGPAPPLEKCENTLL